MRDLLVILPTVNTFFRYEIEGIIQSLKEEAKHGVKVRILMQRTASNNSNSTLKEEKVIQDLIKDPL
jgi:phosphatidylserine/phosphatidylglycerophosphate/cardiolipin synthase-like enzyme